MGIALVFLTIGVATIVGLFFGADSRPRLRSREEDLANLGITWEMHSPACDGIATHTQIDVAAWPQLPLYPCRG